MSDIQFTPIWGDPPSSRGGGPNKPVDLALEAFVALLRTAPGRWAELSSIDDDGGHPTSRAGIIKRRYPDVDIQTRAIPGGTKTRRRIWVRVKTTVPDVIAANGDRQQKARERAATASE
jgi:hypothetical protein